MQTEYGILVLLLGLLVLVVLGKIQFTPHRVVRVLPQIPELRTLLLYNFCDFAVKFQAAAAGREKKNFAEPIFGCLGHFGLWAGKKFWSRDLKNEESWQTRTSLAHSSDACTTISIF